MATIGARDVVDRAVLSVWFDIFIYEDIIEAIMLIRCPQCGFERTLDVSQIPDSAVMATCPKCESKFRFRDKPPVARFTPPTPLEDDPLPPGAIVPPLRHTHHNEEETPPSGQPDPGNSQTKPKRAQTRDHVILDKKDPLERPEPSQRPRQQQPYAEMEQDTSQPVDEENISPVPWEAAPLSAMPLALYHTLLGALFAAPSFFRAVGASQVSLLRAYIFYVILGVFQSLMQRFWILSRLTEQLDALPEAQALIDTAAQSFSIPMLLLLSPPLLMAQLLIYGGLFHLMIRLVQPDRADLSTVLRVVAYSAAPCIFSVVPLVGMYVSSVWFAICCFVGLKYALRLSWHKTALATLPLYILSVLFSLHLSRMLISMNGG